MKLNLSKSEWILFIVFGLVILFVPILMTSEFSLISFTDTGQIGDTIGGTTAPFLGFFGSILVYLALKAQIDANEQVRKQFKKQEEDAKIDKKNSYYKEKISLIKLEINNFYFSYNESVFGNSREQKFNYEGSQAIFKLLKKIKDYHLKEADNIYNIFPKLGELESLLLFFDQTVNELKSDKVLTIENKKSLFEITEYLFYSKLKYNFDSLTKYKTQYDKPCENCGEYHGIPEKVFNYFENIEISMNSINIAFKL